MFFYFVLFLLFIVCIKRTKGKEHATTSSKNAIYFKRLEISWWSLGKNWRWLGKIKGARMRKKEKVNIFESNILDYLPKTVLHQASKETYFFVLCFLHVMCILVLRITTIKSLAIYYSIVTSLFYIIIFFFIY